MAGLTIRLALVVEGRILPATGIVATRALAAVMVGRFVATVAGLAVRLSLVIEAGRLPGIGVVTARTLAAVVVGRFIFGVTGLAVRRPGSLMIELGCSLPGAGGMAV